MTVTVKPAALGAAGLPLYRLHLMRAGYLPWRYAWRTYATANGDRWR